MALCFLQNKFLVCYTYFFLVFTFCIFSCCGFGQNSEAFTLFGCCGLVLVLFAVFISYRRLQCVCFLVVVFGGQVGLLLFQKTVFKIIPGFAVFAFCRSSFGWTV